MGVGSGCAGRSAWAARVGARRGRRGSRPGCGGGPPRRRGSAPGRAPAGRRGRRRARPGPAGDQGDAEARADQREVGVELHRDVGDPRAASGAVVHPAEPLAADRALRRGDPALVDQVARGDRGAAGQPVVAVDDDVGDVAGDRGAHQVVGDVDRHVAPGVEQAEVELAGGDQVDGVPRLVLDQGDRSSGWASSRSRTASATSPRMAVEKAAIRRWPATTPVRRCRPASTASRSPSSRPPSSSRWRPSPVTMTPRPTRSRSATPVCRSSRLTCWETALGV